MKKINIIYEDKYIIVCHKQAGVAVQTKNIRQQDLEGMLLNELASRGEKPEIYVVHRLDQPVEGIIVFAKTKEAASSLSRQFAKKDMVKEYLAVVSGKFDEKDVHLEDYLLKDGKSNTSHVVDSSNLQAKIAVLDLKVIKDIGDNQLVKIHLKTGRHHQIRVQLANSGHPIIGDKKYNPDYVNQKGFVQTALCAHRIVFEHPETKKIMEFSVQPEAETFYGN